MQVRDGVAVDFVVHLRWLHKVVERSGDGHGFSPKRGQFRLIKIERLRDMSLRDHTRVPREWRLGWGGDPDRRKFPDQIERPALSTDDAVLPAAGIPSATAYGSGFVSEMRLCSRG